MSNSDKRAMRGGIGACRLAGCCAAVMAAFALPQAATAFEINTGNEDLTVRFDNTLRINVAQRVQGQDAAMIANPNYDDGDRNFDKGHVFGRFDILSEFDIVFQRKYGFRISAAGWWDPGYNSLDNQSVATSNYLVNGKPALGLSDYTNRYGKGPSGEWLDVFAFGTFDVGGVPVSAKIGQHTVYWGDSLLLGGAIHGVSYSQNPLDLWKGLATPGAEAKELFRPRVGLTVQAQPAADLSVAAQYFFNWQRFSTQAYRYPESGSYLTVQDALLWGGDSLIVQPNPLAALVPGAPAYLRAWRGTDIVPENNGDFGLSARWSPEWLDGTAGIYYRRTIDMQPQVMLTPAVLPLPAAICTAIKGIPLNATTCIANPAAATPAQVTQQGKFGLYNLAYGTDIDIFGVSLSKNIAGVSVGAELSYRQNMPLISDPVFVVPAPLVAAFPGSIATTAVPEHGTPGARGKTMHGLVNLVGIVNKTPLFDTATWQTELTWMQWLSVTENEAVFKGRDGYNQIDRVSKNFVGLGINFTPTWFQVFPGVDILMPVSWSQGLSGNAAVTSGGSKGAGTYGIGVAADVRQQYRFDLKYVGFYGDYSTLPSGAMNIPNGVPAALSDRGFVSLTFKTTF